MDPSPSTSHPFKYEEKGTELWGWRWFLALGAGAGAAAASPRRTCAPSSLSRCSDRTSLPPPPSRTGPAPCFSSMEEGRVKEAVKGVRSVELQIQALPWFARTPWPPASGSHCLLSIARAVLGTVQWSRPRLLPFRAQSSCSLFFILERVRSAGRGVQKLGGLPPPRPDATCESRNRA